MEKIVPGENTICHSQRILTVTQQIKTTKKPSMAPQVPTIQVILIKRMTPKMFWRQGRNTPNSVPRLAFSGAFWVGSSGAF